MHIDKCCTMHVYQVLHISSVRFRIGKKIANGAFGQLRVVKDLSTGEVSSDFEKQVMDSVKRARKHLF